MRSIRLYAYVLRLGVESPIRLMRKTFFSNDKPECFDYGEFKDGVHE